MRPTILSTIVLAGLLAALLHIAPAHALNVKSWVSNAGDDADSCTLARPCKSFAAALSRTLPGGEVGVLTPGGYGPIVGFKSFNLTNDGSGEAGIIVASAGRGIEVDAGAGDVISLRGLVIDGQLGGMFGILFNSGSALHIQNCIIRNFLGPVSASGLVFDTSNNSQLFVSDTLVYNINSSFGPDADFGAISIRAGDPGVASAVLNRVRFENNVNALRVTGANALGVRVVLRDSVLSGNVGDGVAAIGGHGPAVLFVERTTAVNNGGNGILAAGLGAVVLLSESAVVRNAVGVATVNGGQLISYGNNEINNNLGPDGAPTGSFRFF